MGDTATSGLRTQRLSLGYGGRAVVSELDLHLPPGRFTAILGPNGCGKSTLLRSLAGLHPCSGGSVTLDGRPLSSFRAKALAREISILGQGSETPDGVTVAELVRQGRYPHRSLLGAWTPADSEAVRSALEMTGMDRLAHRSLRELSGGQRQRAWIAMTLAQEGRILLLDEPTTFLDPAHQLEVLGLVRRLVSDRGTTVVAVLHDLNLASRFADHIVLLREGKLEAEGPAREVLTRAALARVFGVDVAILDDPETGAPVLLPRLPATTESLQHTGTDRNRVLTTSRRAE